MEAIIRLTPQNTMGSTMSALEDSAVSERSEAGAPGPEIETNGLAWTAVTLAWAGSTPMQDLLPLLRELVPGLSEPQQQTISKNDLCVSLQET
jgi:hypothetical protein